MFEDASQNTFSPDFKKTNEDAGIYPIDTKVVQVEPLAQVFEKNLKSKQEIDYLNVDVEGLDLEVLKSNDWTKYRPIVISVEDIEFDIESPNQSEIYTYLKDQGYRLKSFAHITLIFENQR